MYENIDEIININLNALFSNKLSKMYTLNFTNINDKVLNRSNRILLSEIMSDKGLIKITGKTAELLPFGYEICKNGGWIKYIDLLNEKEEIEKNISKQKEIVEKAKEDVKTQKLIDDAKVSKFNAKYRYIPFVFAGIGLIISIISIAIALKSKKESITEKQLSKSEIVKIIDSISASIQTKKVDSLHISKNAIDSLN